MNKYFKYKTNIMKPFSTLLLILALALNLPHTNAQDPIHSEYLTNSILLNPALTGVIPRGNQNRITISHKDQWSSILDKYAFKTFTAAYDTYICAIGSTSDFIGLGFSSLYDQAGIYSLKRTHFHAKASYGLQLAELNANSKLYMVGGFEIGLINNALGNNDLRFDEQFDGFDFDASIPGEQFANNQTNMLDLGAGIFLYTTATSPTAPSVKGGASFKHVNRPTYRFFESDNSTQARLPMRVSGFAQVVLGTEDSGIAAVLKGAYFHQWPFQQINAGVSVLLDLLTASSNSNRPRGWILMAGASLRRVQSLDSWHNDAIILGLNLSGDRFAVQASYDFNISNLNQFSNTVGAFELGFSYYIPASRHCEIDCPYNF